MIRKQSILKTSFVMVLCTLYLYTVWIQQIKNIKKRTDSNDNVDIKHNDENSSANYDTMEEHKDKVGNVTESEIQQLKTWRNKYGEMERLPESKMPIQNEVNQLSTIPNISNDVDLSKEGDNSTWNLSSYDRLNVTMKSKVPQFILGGVKKCGTGTLMTFVNRHPQIVRSQLGGFFVEEASFAKGTQWYYDNMVIPTGNRVILERCNGCYDTLKAPGRLTETLGRNVYMIWMVRDPIDRLESEIAQQVSNKEKASPEEILKESITKESITDTQIIRRGLYHVYLQHWLQFLPLDHFLFIETSDFIKKPWVELSRLEKFMNLTKFFREDMFIPGEGEKEFFCIRNTNFSSKGDVTCMGDGKGREHPKFDNITADKLEQFYLPHSKAFFQEIQHTYTWRGIPNT